MLVPTEATIYFKVTPTLFVLTEKGIFMTVGIMMLLLFIFIESQAPQLLLEFFDIHNEKF